MTIAPHHTEIHQMVDRLSLVEAEALYVLLKSTIGERLPDPEPIESMLADEPVRTFAFAGLMHAGPDYAARSSEILRNELGRREFQAPSA
jgi:hypothetical protein